MYNQHTISTFKVIPYKEYETEKILGHYQRGPIIKNLVHWHSYNDVEDSLVPEQDLIHVQQILQYY